jgi:hypothetical protein
MASKTSAADILARFPGPVTLHPSLKRWGLIFAGSALFAIGGEWMIRSGAFGGWLVLIFFGAVTVIAAVAMLPGAGALTLDAAGFEVTSLYRHSRTRWQEASDFTAARIPPSRQRFVVFNHTRTGRRLAAVNKFIAGRSASLPDTYGLSSDDLAQVMTQWRERAAATVELVG